MKAIKYNKSLVEKLSDEYSNLILFLNDKIVYKATIPNKQLKKYL